MQTLQLVFAAHLGGGANHGIYCAHGGGIVPV
jgi:hypothetical protein